MALNIVDYHGAALAGALHELDERTISYEDLRDRTRLAYETNSQCLESGDFSETHFRTALSVGVRLGQINESQGTYRSTDKFAETMEMARIISDAARKSKLIP